MTCPGNKVLSQEEVNALLRGLTVPNHPNYDPKKEDFYDKLRKLGFPVADNVEKSVNYEPELNSCEFQPSERIIQGRFPFLEDLLYRDLEGKLRNNFCNNQNIINVNTITIDICRGEYYRNESNKRFLVTKLNDDKNLLYAANSEKLIKKMTDLSESSHENTVDCVIEIFNKYFNFRNRIALFDNIDYRGELFRCGFEFIFSDKTTAFFEVLIPMETILRNEEFFKYGPKNQETECMFDNVLVDLSVEFDTKKISIRELKSLKVGSLIELDSYAGSPVTIYAGDKKIGRGEMLVINENYGVRVKELNT